MEGTDGGEARWAGNDGISSSREDPGLDEARTRHGEACSYPEATEQPTAQAATAGGDGERPVRGRPQGTEKNGRAEAAHG